MNAELLSQHCYGKRLSKLLELLLVVVVRSCCWLFVLYQAKRRSIYTTQRKEHQCGHDCIPIPTLVDVNYIQSLSCYIHIGR